MKISDEQTYTNHKEEALAYVTELEQKLVKHKKNLKKIFCFIFKFQIYILHRILWEKNMFRNLKKFRKTTIKK